MEANLRQKFLAAIDSAYSAYSPGVRINESALAHLVEHRVGFFVAYIDIIAVIREEVDLGNLIRTLGPYLSQNSLLVAHAQTGAGDSKYSVAAVQRCRLETVAINDHICPSCGNKRVSKSEKSCWKCGNSLHG
jgi:hypothetical protein